MKYLLDTHVLLWIANDDPKLSPTARALFLDDSHEMYFSIASVWELAIKSSLSKLALAEPLKIFLEEHVIKNEIAILPVETKHILPLENLPFLS